MRGLRLGLVGLGLVAAGGAVAVALVPGGLRLAAARAGIRVGTASWCAEGLCLADLGAPVGDAQVGDERVTVARGTIGWDRAVRLVDLHVPLAGVAAGIAAAGGGGGAAGSGAGGSGSGASDRGAPDQGAGVLALTGGAAGWLAAGITAVDVDGLVIDGAPLPALSGRIYPTRALTGDGVAITGDTVSATVPTPFGAFAVEARPGAAGVEIVATCENARLPAPSESDEPLVVPVLAARGVWKGGAFVGTVDAGDVRFQVDVHRDGEGFAGTATLPDTPIDAVYTLLVPSAPELARARIGGTVHATATGTWPGGLTALDPGVSGFTVAGLVSDGLAAGSFSFRGLDAAGDEVLLTSGEGTPDWVPLPAMGAWLPAAVIATEDAGFREHPGYDLAGMQEAAARNTDAGAIVRGGSTLTQQLAKNLFLDGTRSYERKLRELLYAVDLEEHLGKRRILELYLNVVEFGPGIRGARAAARTYFLKEPAGLLPEEAAWLASILRNPRTAYRTQYLAERPDEARVDWILENLRDVPEPERTAALARPLRLVPP
jgi:hypothetical protein